MAGLLFGDDRSPDTVGLFQVLILGYWKGPAGEPESWGTEGAPVRGGMVNLVDAIRARETPSPPPAPDKMDLDAWLAEHVGCEKRRAEVRATVDCLSDFRVASLEDLEDALGLAAWPALSKIRFLNAWRRLKDGEDASSEPQRPRSAPVSAAELAGSTRAREPSSRNA